MQTFRKVRKEVINALDTLSKTEKEIVKMELDEEGTKCVCGQVLQLNKELLHLKELLDEYLGE